MKKNISLQRYVMHKKQKENKMKHYKTIEKCRVCYSKNMDEVLRLDEQYIASTFVKSNESHPMSNVKIPMTLMLCKECGLVQLKETVDPALLYNNYFYRTSVNDTMRRDLKEVVDETIKYANLKEGDYVVDIGANDCTMVQMFPNNLNRVAVEPAKNISWANVDKSVKIVNDYFSKEAVLKATGGKKVKALTACAMFYDMDDPNTATKDIKEVLDKDGVCTIQVSHLYFTIKDMNFYDICHEHLEYYSLKTINYLMEKNGLYIFDAKTNFVNGGSLRVSICHHEAKRERTKDFFKAMADEEKLNLDSVDTYKKYASHIKTLADRSKRFIENEVKNGGRVIGLGASTKGNVLLQICGITKKLLPYISERNKEKFGLRTLGTDIELISEEAARKMNPTCMLVIPWNFKDEIVKREQEYIKNGGRLLFIMPEPYYIDKNGETKING